MRAKFITGIVLLIIGIVLIGMGFHYKQEIATAHGDVEKATSPFKDNMAVDIAKDLAHGKISSYEPQVRWLFIGGITIALVGAAVILYPKKRG